MEYIFRVEVLVKNDALTKDTTKDELATMLAEQIGRSTEGLPWVLSTDVDYIRKERA